MKTKTLLSCCLLAVVAGASMAAAQTRLTLAVECGAQGQVDDPHRLTVTVENCTDGKETKVTIPVQPQTDSSAIANTLATVLDKKGVTGTKSEETTNKRYGGSKHKAEDVVIPSGYKVKSVKVEKKPKDEWQCDDGHLQAYIGKKQVSNQLTRRSHLPTSQSSTDRIVADGVFSWLTITLLSTNANNFALVLDLYEPESEDGTSVLYTYEATFFPGETVEQALQALGIYLEDLGMTVLYPNDHTLTADIAASGLPIAEGYFSAQVLEAAPNGETRFIELSFDLE